jgi:hypothetical protein
VHIDVNPRSGSIEIEQITKYFMGIALEYIDVMSSDKMPDTPQIELKLDGTCADGHEIAKFVLRIDAFRQLQIGNHIRICPSQPPKNAPNQKTSTADGLVIRSDRNQLSIRCLHRLSSYTTDCPWEIRSCRSSITSKAMFTRYSCFIHGS